MSKKVVVYKYVILMPLAALILCLSGCGKKDEPKAAVGVSPVPAASSNSSTEDPPAPMPPAPSPAPRPAPATPGTPLPAPMPKPVPQPVPPLDRDLGVPAWGAAIARRPWTEAVRNVVRVHLAQFERAADRNEFCPGYDEANRHERVNCWVMLVAAVSFYESDFLPGTKYLESNGKYSVGLLALTAGECPMARDVQMLQDPVLNLTCGTAIMARAIGRDGYVNGPAERRGAAAYWSSLRNPYRQWSERHQRYLSLGKKPLILPMVRGYRGKP